MFHSKRLLVCLLGIWLCAYSLAAAASEPQAQQAKLDQLRQRIGQLTQDLHLDRGRLDSYQNELREIERHIAQQAISLKALDEQLQRSQERLARLEPQQRQQQAQLQRHRQLLAQQLRSAYLMGRQDRLKLLLHQQEPARLARLLRYHEYIDRARNQQIQQLQLMLQEQEQTRRQLAEERQRLSDLRQETDQRQQQLEQDKAERSRVLAKLASEIGDKDKQLASLKRNEADLKQLISQLQRTMSELAVQQNQQSRFATGKGRLSWPVKGPLVARFGSPRTGGISWDGVFIRASEGSEVRAIQPGRVAFADWLRGYGLLLIIDHGEGYMSLYGHNQSLFKKVGETVAQAEPIAQAGGGAPQDHGIYFGIRHRGKPVDPALWCR
ncbi:MAG: peptidoglycan DD-metalloendopeptidase family protein [Gammaproteobacteria bacterium]|nr:peptidoglycan DD-metalloendopeptidase family protein [Gammaproteobacteria bacterium]